MTAVNLLRSAKPGVAPEAEDLRPRGLMVNTADRIIFYRDKEGKLRHWYAGDMPDDLWDRFANGFDLMRA